MIAHRRKSSTLRRREALKGYLYISPWLAGFAIFTFFPIVASAFLSLTQYEVVVPPRFIGLANYGYALGVDDYFWKTVYNTVYYMVLFVPLSLVGSLGAALLLNQRVRGQAVFRTLFFIPSVTPVVASTLLWMWILNYEFGPLNSVLAAIGIQGPPWLSSSLWAKPSIVMMSLWGAVGGGNMIIILAGLQGISQELYEAADIDGANRWQKLLNITLPMLSPSMFFCLVVGLIGALKIFTPAYIATDGGPGYATTFYVLYLFQTAFQSLNMGYASALAWLLLFLTLGLVMLQFYLASRWVYYEGARGR